jgi:LPXTG-motif cell wall-anchored protein
MRKARFVIPVIALGGLAIGSFVLLRRRRNQSA